MKTLLKIKGFLPFLVILFLNASTDIAHKITLQNSILKSFDGDELIILTSIINAMILLPFIFLFSPSAFVSSRFFKTHVIRYSALFAVFITIFITISYIYGLFWIAFALTFILALQSAIYSPAKYGVIKDLVGVKNIGAANGLVQAITIVAILLSSIVFSIIFEYMFDVNDLTPDMILSNMSIIGFIMIALTSIEFLSTYKLPIVGSKDSHLKFFFRDYLSLRTLKSNISITKQNKYIWQSIIGLSLFWGVSQVVISSFGAYYKEVTLDDNTIVVQGILAVSAIGIMFGSIVAGRLSKLHINLGIVPVGAIGMFASILLLTNSTSIVTLSLITISFGFFGGLFIVPLNSLIQYLSYDKDIGTIMAGNNFVQNIVMVLFLVISIFMAQIGYFAKDILVFISIVALLGTFYSILKLPHLFARSLLIPTMRFRYKFFIKGIENIPPNSGALLLGNHTSWIDWLVLQMASPRALKFVMDKNIYNKWYINWFVKLFDTIPISPLSSKGSIVAIKERLDAGQIVVLFPEGHISDNGQMSEFKRGFEKSIQGTEHTIIPFFIRGLWGSTFSRSSKRFRNLSKSFKKREIDIVFGKALNSQTNATTLKQKVFEVSLECWEDYTSRLHSLQYNWIKSAKSNLFRPCITDFTGTLSNAKFITAVLLFIKKLKPKLTHDEFVGIILPSSSAGAITNMALFCMGKKPVNLNYTLDTFSLLSAIDKAGIKKIITSKQFMTKLKAKGFDLDCLDPMSITLEDFNFSLSSKVFTTLQAYLYPTFLLKFLFMKKVSLNDTATVLFSSGSESAPKGIELTHKNLISNIKQVMNLLNPSKEDKILASLPIFHSFGFTVTTLLPLCEGLPLVCVPDPTDASSIGKNVYKHQVTLIFGTSTFYRLYAKNKRLHPAMFSSVRLAIAGAEKLKIEVKQDFKEKFGIDIYEGYGTTETTPAVSQNMPDSLDPDTFKPLIYKKQGSVGLPLPGTVIKIVDPNTLEELKANEDGEILIGGVQVMKGYLHDTAKTNEAIITINNQRFYRTGDKGHLDEDGFIFIVDRYSRFAKIGAEMISLGSVEAQIRPLFKEDIEICATNIPDSKKGEGIVLLFKSELNAMNVEETIKSSDIVPIMKPSLFLKVEEIPKLGTGKMDFKKAKDIALKFCQK